MNYPLQEAKKDITKSLEKALKKIGCKSDVKLETPPEKMGDFAFPCFILASELKKPPQKIAEDIGSIIDSSENLEKTVTQGGYINFYLKDDKLIDDTFKSVYNRKEEYGYLDKKNKKVIIEHTSANPNGPLHVGRARNPIIGDTLVRIFKAAGFNVESQFYVDDMGKQVAILTWGVKNFKDSEISKDIRDKPDHKTVGFYQKATKKMNEDPEIEEQINNIIKKSEEGDPETIEVIHKAYKPVLKGMLQSLEEINIKINKFVPESKFVEDKSVYNVIKKLKNTKYCEEEDGAFYLDLESFGVKGRSTKFFFLRKDGTTLYATRDIAYHIWKAKNADLLVNVLGEDHKLESKQVEIALTLTGETKLPKPIFYSFVSLPGGKMSTRRNRVVFLDDLIDECIQRAYVEVNKRRGDELTKSEMQEISKKIGRGALRYNIIKVQPEKDIIFKWGDALSFEGNSSPFIQYSHARACSILEKKEQKDEGVFFDSKKVSMDSEIKLIKKIAEFPLIVEDASQSYKPHIICQYLYEISALFNQFYRDCPVLHEKNDEIRRTRLAIVEITKISLKNGLNLLGIEAPQEM